MGARNDIIELEPVSDADGNITWAQIIEHIDAHENGVTTGREIVVRPGGTLDLVSAEQATGLSRLPQERMAGGDNDWDRIISTIQAKEAGHTTGTELVVRPGGKIDVVQSDQATGLSQLPQDRMATNDDRPTEIVRLDPHNRENWERVPDSRVPGWIFTLTPIAKPFTFFAFPWGSGRWYVSAASPKFDDLVGHKFHVVNLRLGSGPNDSIPVICRETSRSDHPNLTEVRGTAAKFALYHSLLAHGHQPFST